MHWNALQKLIWSIFLWSFFDYCSSTAAFSKLFSVVEVCASLQKLTQLRAKDDWETSSGTILLYSRNLYNIVTISAKHQILRYIWRKNKLCHAWSCELSSQHFCRSLNKVAFSWTFSLQLWIGYLVILIGKHWVWFGDKT